MLLTKPCCLIVEGEQLFPWAIPPHPVQVVHAGGLCGPPSPLRVSSRRCQRISSPTGNGSSALGQLLVCHYSCKLRTEILPGQWLGQEERGWEDRAEASLCVPKGIVICIACMIFLRGILKRLHLCSGTHFGNSWGKNEHTPTGKLTHKRPHLIPFWFRNVKRSVTEINCDWCWLAAACKIPKEHPHLHQSSFAFYFLKNPFYH